MNARIRAAFLFFALTATVGAITFPADAGAGNRRNHSYTSPQFKKSSPSENSKYAAFVVDTTTGRILHQESADQSRYPASLTKMMTLYMAFEALENKKLTLNQKLPVSAHAAGMPQTNIALKKGDRISVKDVIESMVVRSANDSAVVMAEALGGTESGFASKMTAKAHMLGMKNTVFKNASGLPNSGQLTTARDMAALGIALRRDFPQYYPFFKKDKFVFRGRTYTGHNRVMNRYSGVDGIKTGYTRASGFNLVSSVNKNGHTLVAVVMGGKSSGSRDDHMIDLLDRSYAMLNRPGRDNNQFARMQQAAPPKNIDQLVEQALAEGDTGDAMPLLVAEAETPVPQPRPVRYTGEYEEASLAPFSSNLGNKEWGIQVGAFKDPKQALIAATRAMDIARESLEKSRIEVTGAGMNSRTVHRARLVTLSEEDAKTACSKLLSLRESCFAYRVDPAQSL